MKQSFTKPQRLTQPSVPGSLFKHIEASGVHIRLKGFGDRDPVYLSLLRQCPCLKCGMDPSGEAAHVRLQSAAHGKRGGIGKKPADRWALPLCAACHRQDKDALHQIGETLFWHLLDLDPLLLCERLYAARGVFVAMRAVVTAAVAGRRR